MAEKDEEMDHDNGNPFLTQEDLIARMRGKMFPKGKQFAPSLVMWGDPHGHDEDIDALSHLSPPEEDGHETKD
ncbi:MAG: hypothetical protein AAGI28_07310 [Pseudomonadota bacterium]